jgi:hypothetical protein
MAVFSDSIARVAFFRPIAENNIPFLKKIISDNETFDFNPIVDKVNLWWSERLLAVGIRASVSIRDLLETSEPSMISNAMTQPMLNDAIGVLVQVLSVYFYGSFDFDFCVGVSLGHVASLIVSMSESREQLLSNIPKGLDVLYFILRSHSEANPDMFGTEMKCMMSVSGKRGSKILNNTIKPVLRDFRNVKVAVVWSQNGVLLSGMPEDLAKIEVILSSKNIKFLYTTLIPISFPMHNPVYNEDLVKLAHKHIDSLDCSYYSYNTPILDLSTAEMLEDMQGARLVKRIIQLICCEPNHVPYMEDGVPVGKKLAILDFGCGGMRGGVIGMIQDAMSNLDGDEYELFNYHFDGCRANILELKST